MKKPSFKESLYHQVHHLQSMQIHCRYFQTQPAHRVVFSHNLVLETILIMFLIHAVMDAAHSVDAGPAVDASQPGQVVDPGVTLQLHGDAIHQALSILVIQKANAWNRPVVIEN